MSFAIILAQWREHIRRVIVMKFCSKCGAELNDQAVFCDRCGTPVSQTENSAPVGQNPTPVPAAKTNSGLSVAALVLSILGFLTGFLGIGMILDVIAIVLAIVVLVKARKKPLKKGMAIAGLLVSIISLVLCAVIILPTALGGLFMPSKEDMLEDAMNVDLRSYAIETYSNKAAVESKYQDQVCIVSGYVDNIQSDSVTLVWHTGNSAYFTDEEIAKMDGDAFFASTFTLPVTFADDSELLNLSKGQEITVVGIMDTTFRNLENAYLVTE